MIRSALRTVGIIFLALAGSAAIAWLLFWTATKLPIYGIRVEDLLPENETLLLMRHPSPALLTRLTALFPALDSAEIDVNAEATALVTLSDGTEAVVTFLKKTDARPMGDTLSIGPFYLRTSDERLKSLLTNPSAPLARSKAFRALNRNEEDVSGSYMLLPTVADTSMRGSLMRAGLLHGHTHAWLTATDASMHLSLFGADPDQTDAANFPLLGENLWELSHGSLADAWNKVSARLSHMHRLPLKAVAHTWLTEKIGNEREWEIELLPLLDGASAIGLIPSGSGTALMLRFDMNAEKTAALARLHENIGSSTAGMHISSYVLDETHTFEAIRADGTQVADHSTTQGRWKIRETNESFLSAHDGSKALVLIGADRSLLDRLLAQAAPSEDTDPPFASGRITPSAAKEATVFLPPLAESTAFAPLLPLMGSGGFLFEIRSKNDLTSLEARW